MQKYSKYQRLPTWATLEVDNIGLPAQAGNLVPSQERVGFSAGCCITIIDTPAEDSEPSPTNVGGNQDDGILSFKF